MSDVSSEFDEVDNTDSDPDFDVNDAINDFIEYRIIF